MANDPKRTLLLMFERPSQPLFYPRKPGDSSKDVVFETPASFAPVEYRPNLQDLQTRFGSGDQEKISIRAPSSLPNIKQIERLDKRENFTLFIPEHRAKAAKLIEIFLGARDINEFTSIVAYVRDNINAGLFNYALSVAIMHRNDTKDLGNQIPSLVEIFPNKFVGSEVFPKMLAEASIRDEGERIPIEIPRQYTASNLDIEQRLAYFREDLGINLHHWHWHLVYPFSGPEQVVNKDRRGELFYYMHEQIVARYNFERLCNNLARVEKFNDFREPIPQGYFPKLDSLVGNRNWPPRLANITISDVNRRTDNFKFEILDLERWRDKLYEAIHAGFILDKRTNRNVDLTESTGIDILGDLIEASIKSRNGTLYGDLHNFGHLAFATSHDPDGRYLEPLGVMGDTATAMRDPVFYRWHSFIDDIFQEHKATLPSYTPDRLTFPGISITKVELLTKGSPPNQMHTKWQKSVVNMERGLDFYPRGAILAKFTHLQHDPFQMKITVNNTGEAKTGTVRIFLSPKFDERGAPWNFNEHRLMFIELDKFLVPLKKGNTTLDRQSTQSSVTIPFERVFRPLGSEARPETGNAAAAFNFCGCGWPQHMLIPKGVEGQGLPCQLFVMISNYADDKVDQPSVPRPCSDAASYCGIRDGKYPDRKSMGYPFDRRASTDVDRLEDFLTPNMFVLDVNIVHHNTVTDVSSQQMQQLQTRGGQTRPSGSGGRPWRN